MDQFTNNRPDPSSPPVRDSDVLGAIRADIETELARLEGSADLPDDDEPGRQLLLTRLQSLRDAAIALEGSRRDP